MAKETETVAKKRTPLAYALITLDVMGGDILFPKELKHYLETLAADLEFVQSIIDIQEEAIEGLRAATNPKK